MVRPSQELVLSVAECSVNFCFCFFWTLVVIYEMLFFEHMLKLSIIQTVNLHTVHVSILLNKSKYLENIYPGVRMNVILT